MADDPVRITESSLLWGRRFEPRKPAAKPVVTPIAEWHDSQPDPPAGLLPRWSPSTRLQLALIIARLLQLP